MAGKVTISLAESDDGILPDISLITPAQCLVTSIDSSASYLCIHVRDYIHPYLLPTSAQVCTYCSLHSTKHLQ